MTGLTKYIFPQRLSIDVDVDYNERRKKNIVNKTEATKGRRLSIAKKRKKQRKEKHYYSHLIFCYYVELKLIAVTYRLQFLNLFKLLISFRKCNTEVINGEVGFQGASTWFTEHRPLRGKNRRLNETLKRYV